MTRVGAYVKFAARPGQRDTLAERLLAAARMVSDAAGCELYVVNASPDEPDTIWVTEIWRSEADRQASLNAEGARDLIGQTLALLAGPPERIDTVPLGGLGLSPR